ncbi:hypothetical protein OH799_14745 [Nocardia sp. NBC_00881]|uniref:hypothetical protein n=1 Tax=Nocardia sp. NBC_00881 TaxID=2975995 RepID=UPI0038657E0B|nr:hypothetical protein OH799_14745 [Nocardia sp. NBC_00881]
MPAPSPGTSTAFRLARITALVLGCLVFLYACERSKSAVLSDVWVEVAVAGGFGVAGLVAAWFEIALNARNRQEDADRRRADSAWDDDEEHDEAPIHGNFSGRSTGLDDENARSDRAERTGRPARPDSVLSLEDDDRLDTSTRANLTAWIPRTLRGGWADTADADEPAPPLLAKWSALTKWVRRTEPDVDLVDDDIDHVERTETGELVVESSRWTMRARIVRSGDLVFHRRERGGAHPQPEWKWTFHPDAFPAIRTALGATTGDLLDLLEQAIPRLEPGARHDPGAWLRAHDIPAMYREKGVSAAEVTRELPVLRPGLPAPASSPDRRPRGHEWPTTAQPETWSGGAEPAPSERTARRRTDSERARSSGPLPQTGAEQSSRSRRRPPARPDQPDRRRDDRTDYDEFATPDDRPDTRDERARRSRQYPSPAYEAATHRRPPTDRQPGRQRDPYPPMDFEPARRRATPPTPNEHTSRPRARFAPSDHHAEPSHDQPAPGRRGGRDQPPPAHEPTSRRRW